MKDCQKCGMMQGGHQSGTGKGCQKCGTMQGGMMKPPCEQRGGAGHRPGAAKEAEEFFKQQ